MPTKTSGFGPMVEKYTRQILNAQLDEVVGVLESMKSVSWEEPTEEYKSGFSTAKLKAISAVKGMKK